MDHRPWTMDFLKLFYISMMNLRFVSRLLIRFGIAFLILNHLFRIMHWPYRDIFLLSGFAAIGLGYIFRFYLKTEKSALDYIKLGLVEFWSLHGIFGYMDWPGYRFLYYATIVFAVAWLIMGGLASFFESQNVAKGSLLYKLTIPVLVILILCIGIGSLFKIMHWPNADLLLNIGMFGAAAWVLLLTIQKSSAFANGNSIKPEENRRASADKENHKS